MWPIFTLLAAGLWLVAALLFHRRSSDPGEAQPRRLADGWEEGETAYIAFASSPNKCWKALGPQTSVTNGVALVIWDCHNADKFLVPSNGFGMIRLERDKRFCLDAPGGTHQLQVWHCDDAPGTNVQFTLPTPGNAGAVKPAQASMCVDIPSGDTTNGRKLQQWDCNDARVLQNMQFVVRATSRCVWDVWEDWADCQFCKKRRIRKEVPQDVVGKDKITCHARESEVIACETTECEKF